MSQQTVSVTVAVSMETLELYLRHCSLTSEYMSMITSPFSHKYSTTTSFPAASLHSLIQANKAATFYRNLILDSPGFYINLIPESAGSTGDCDKL